MPPLIDQTGYWGERTATIDWCEKNYVENYYIAEMWNTISNFLMIFQAIWGIIDVFKNDLEKKFIIAYTFLLVVGMGSWAFHMTLLYQMQLFDELPMVWGTCYSVYLLYGIKPSKSLFAERVIGLGMFCFAVMFTLFYLYYPLPAFQHIAFGILAIVSYLLEVWLIRERRCNLCRLLFILSFASYSFGFFLWNVDKFYCSNLTSIREVVPSWFSPVTQLHAWWHCFAGHGTYLNVLIAIHLHYDYRQRNKDEKLHIEKLGLRVHWKTEKNK